MEQEIFKDIKGYEGLYKIGNKGTVISFSRSNDNRYKDRNWILKQYKDKNGYMYVILSKNKKRKIIKIHRLVAENFIDNPFNYPCVNHIDSNRSNNSVDNLEWCTHKQNIQWALKTGRFENVRIIQRERAINNHLGKNYVYANEATKKKVVQYDKNNNLIARFDSISEASRKTGIKIASISYVCNGKNKTAGGYIWHFA